MAAGLRIWLLGGFRAELGSGPVAEAAWRRSRARAVVELLALAPGHRLHREQLMEELWPELAPEAASANLRKAVHFARQALGSEHLRLSGVVLSLEAAPLWIDVDAFEAATEAGHLDTAIGIYGGDLLPEDRFAPWASERREQLRGRFALLLAERARALRDAGDAEAAAAAF
jgi:DNA-binding SARP family transcriptional activator